MQEIVTFWGTSSDLKTACESVQEQSNAWLRLNHPVRIVQMDVHHLHIEGQFLAVITLLVRHAPFGEE